MSNLYRHYKGNLYTLLHIGLGSETLKDVAIYRSESDGQVWVRDVVMFFEMIEVDGQQVRRFEPIVESE